MMGAFNKPPAIVGAVMGGKPPAGLSPAGKTSLHFMMLEGSKGSGEADRPETVAPRHGGLASHPAVLRARCRASGAAVLPTILSVGSGGAANELSSVVWEIDAAAGGRSDHGRAHPRARAHEQAGLEVSGNARPACGSAPPGQASLRVPGLASPPDLLPCLMLHGTSGSNQAA